MRLLLFLALLAACASPTPVGAPGDTVTVEGVVTSVDLEPMTYDGDAVIELATDEGPVSVRIPARMNLCEATGLALVGEVAHGDVLVVRGKVWDRRVLTPCTEASHFLKRGPSE